MRILLRSAWRDHDGSALIEGAIVIPVLFVLGLGVLDFSSLFYHQHLISTGVKDAARYLARTSDPTNATLQTDAKTLATTGQITSGGQARVVGWTTADVTVSVVTIANPVGGVNLKLVGASVNQVVTVSTTFTDPTRGVFGFLGSPTYSVSHSERAIKESP